MIQANSMAFCPIPTVLVSCDRGMKFNVYMRKGQSFMLFARDGNMTDAHKQRLRDYAVDTLYIHSEDVSCYDAYVEANFSRILADTSIPTSTRSEILYKYSAGIGKILMAPDNAAFPNTEHRNKLNTLFDSAYDFLTGDPQATKCVLRLVAHSHRTYIHCVNVSLYAMLFLTRQGYDKRTASLLGMGSALHDIGKTWVPKAILDKPRRLSAEERQIIKRHPADGLEICRGMGLDPLAKDCIIHHHEKLDGSGYPARREDIPEHARVVTVADIYDALTSDRPYAKSFSPVQAFRILQKDAEIGRLDKYVCQEFIKILSEGQLILG